MQKVSSGDTGIPVEGERFLHPLRHPVLRSIVKVALDGALGVLAWRITPCLAGQGLMAFTSADFSDSLKWGLVSAVISLVMPLWRQHYRFFGFRDSLRLGLASLLLLVTAQALSKAGWVSPVTPSAAPLAGLLTGAFWAVLRSLHRMREEKTSLCADGIQGGPDEVCGKSMRTLIVGAGRAGLMVAEELIRHPELGATVVGFVDDDFSKQGVRIHNIPVLGPQELLSCLVAEHRVQRVILAIPSASGLEMRVLAERIRNLGVEFKTVPGIYNLLGSREWKPELRDVSIEDLLRRDPITLDQDGLDRILQGQTVLVTGAGGSIGGELARQLCRFRPGHLVLLGRGENSLWMIERELRQAYPGQNLSIALCDIRNHRRLIEVFDRYIPSIVFHAAAHKHVPILERHPEEAIENNVFGTRNVLEAALDAGVRHFVNISTDKAVNPTNVLGVSKRLAELVVADASDRAPGGSAYVSVRFGNVLGSRGSVVPIFRDQILAGGPVTVTHPDMTRYFMTIPEASQLVIQAGLLGETGKVYVLDMGEPVRILDLATDMIRLSGLEPGKEIAIQFSGARPGEKLFEELFHGQARPIPSSVHPKVFEAIVENRAFSTASATLQLQNAMDSHETAQMVEVFQALLPTYRPSDNGLAASTRVENCVVA